MNKVITIHGRILSRCLIYFVGFLMVPVYISDNSRYGFHAIIQFQKLVQAFCFSCCSIVSQDNITDVRLMIDIEDNAFYLVDRNSDFTCLSNFMKILFPVLIGNTVILFDFVF